MWVGGVISTAKTMLNQPRLDQVEVRLGCNNILLGIRTIISDLKTWRTQYISLTLASSRAVIRPFLSDRLTYLYSLLSWLLLWYNVVCRHVCHPVEGPQELPVP